MTWRKFTIMSLPADDLSLVGDDATNHFVDRRRIVDAFDGSSALCASKSDIASGGALDDDKMESSPSLPELKGTTASELTPRAVIAPPTQGGARLNHLRSGKGEWRVRA
ncbi:MAG TPA: hypothetical protein VNO21_09550 [Polyangiaceae bacterium]|nr:hypothetical protein [Polyangiaceae bacterium]